MEIFSYVFILIILRTENTHISKSFAFENAKLKILDKNGQDSQELKKGEMYNIQIDLEDNLTENCKEKNIKIFKILIFTFFDNQNRYSEYRLISKAAK